MTVFYFFWTTVRRSSPQPHQRCLLFHLFRTFHRAAFLFRFNGTAAPDYVMMANCRNTIFVRTSYLWSCQPACDFVTEDRDVTQVRTGSWCLHRSRLQFVRLASIWTVNVMGPRSSERSIHFVRMQPYVQEREFSSWLGDPIV